MGSSVLIICFVVVVIGDIGSITGADCRCWWALSTPSARYFQELGSRHLSLMAVNPRLQRPRVFWSNGTGLLSNPLPHTSQAYA